MDNRRLANEVERLRQIAGPELCEERPCQRVYHTEVERLGGEEVLVKGTPPPPLCDGCPEHAKPAHERVIRHVQVTHNAYTT